ncbi:Mfa1 family fimbria major subunit [Bacteroides caecigallinarum]|uniref:Mfa1 family fimbria major subunit n=1 Tax=Bacteroides caecigallinarum TaxID=1411144 RepID=UPI00195A10CC|nr:Mfa1 family fimbria major subunit [Bacteroides caecigallinarum]MBM6890051.1 Mfa1 family fimbria major subunit [Bacteroides caecigallinarum]
MKLNKLFLLSAMGLGLFACSENELEGNGPEGAQNEGTTYVGFTLKFNDTNSRANGTEEGTAAEQNIKTAYVIMADASGNVEQIVSTAEKGTDYYVFQTTAGVHYFYAVVNPDVIPSKEGDNATAKTINAYFNTGVTLTVANITSTADGGNFMMAGENVLTADVEDGVTKDEALKGTKNSFAINVERVAAKVTMTCENTTLTNATNNADGTITTPKFTLKGGATMSYRMAQSAINEITGNEWTNTSSPTDVYVKTGAETDLHEKATPVYCLENLHDAATGYKQGNTTYLTLQTTFIPARVVNCNATAENGELKDNPNATSSTAVSFYVVKTGSLAGNYILKSELDTFQGVDDTKFPNGVESISAEYVGGTCWFGPIWIGQTDADKENAPVVRNTWYNLKIKGITLPGEPSEPTIDSEQPLTPATNVAITLTVEPWTTVDRDIDLQ